MKIGFKDIEIEKKMNDIFDLYIQMIRYYQPGTKEFNFASQMLRNHLDFMIYNREIQECETLKVRENHENRI